MDSLTHLVAGALTPIAFSRAPKRTSLVLFGILAGEFPDIDAVFGSSPKALLSLHRGLTHALMIQPAWAIFLATIFYFWMRRKIRSGYEADYGPDPVVLRPSTPPRWGWATFFMAALVGLFGHLYLDCMTTFGTQVLLPFSDTRVWFPAVFIVDPVLTVPAFLLLILALLCKPAGADTIKEFSERSRKFARLGLCWILLYPLLSLGINQAVTVIFKTHLQLDEESKLTLVTEPFSPVVWKAIIEKPQSFTMETIYLTAPGKIPLMQSFTKADPALYDKLAARNSIFTDFKKFCSFLVQDEKPDADGNIVYSFMDLRYVISQKSPVRLLFDRTKTNFILEAKLSTEGVFLGWRFLSNSDETPEWRKPEEY